MLLHIITPTSAFKFCMMQSYNNFLPSIEKCSYTYIFIREMCLHIHFYFHALFFNITPTDLQILIFYSYKFLSFSFIGVY